MKYLAHMFLLVLFTTPVSAQDLLLPLLYDVSGVTADDMLNVRDGPGVEHPVQMTLAYDHKGVEVVQLFDEGNWGLIGLSESHGWVSMKYLTVQPGQDTDNLPSPISCFGTEPFWGLYVDDSDATFSDPESPDQLLNTVWQGHVRGRQPTTYGLVMSGTQITMDAIISRSICSDGMSDRAYGFEINTFVTEDGDPSLLTGCCTLQ